MITAHGQTGAAARLLRRTTTRTCSPVAMVSMLNQFCYTQLAGDGTADAVDDDACITTLANIFYRTIYHKETGPHDEDTVIRHTGRDARVRRTATRPPRGGPASGGHPCQGLYHRGVGRKPKVAMIADALPDRLLRALPRRLHGHPRHRLPRLEHPVPRIREQLPARPRAGRHRRRRALAARGAGRGNRCAAGQFRRRFADGRLPGAGRRPARDPAGGDAARGRPRRPAAGRRLRRQRRAPGSPRGADRVDGRRPSSTRTTRSPPIPISTCSTNATARPISAEFVERYRVGTGRAQPRDHRLGRSRTEPGSRRGFLRPAVHRDAHLGRPAHGRPDARADQAASQHVLRRGAGQGQPVRARHRGGLHAAQLARHVEPAARADPRRTAPGAHRLPRAGDQRRTGHRRVSRPTPSASTTRSPSTDKTQCSIDTDHYFTTPGARSEKADTIARWIAKRWR